MDVYNVFARVKGYTVADLEHHLRGKAEVVVEAAGEIQFLALIQVHVATRSHHPWLWIAATAAAAPLTCD